ncbi:hypothetical protein Y1Q_0012714 [Alligator mississippiensis]|uniref:Uncharacterized protein n=1 Tax=Alligator mississippiensis TaxID=8496 RepID=A0A151M8N2_ALLMI|nr:hypothetical protein Y1Q_0012714 [Alligator mississippiensis]
MFRRTPDPSALPNCQAWCTKEVLVSVSLGAKKFLPHTDQECHVPPCATARSMSSLRILYMMLSNSVINSNRPTVMLLLREILVILSS